MSLRYLTLVRRFATSSLLRRSYLSADYKSKELWDERFNCKLLGSDEQIIKTINNKIIVGDELNNTELDIFINIAVPSSEEVAQLQESVRILSTFRKSIYAHTLLPSSPHALGRLFLYSNRLHSLLLILEDRVKYGIFPDFFLTNLLLDECIDKEDYPAASRIANQVMLQEDFGTNPITDNLSLLAVLKYIESKPDFSQWKKETSEEEEAILNPQTEEVVQETSGQEKKEESKQNDDDEDEDDAQYIRIPFLRNPYFDNHFDITNPRILCGKTLSMLAGTITESDAKFATQVNILGLVLQGKWSEASLLLKNSGSNIDNSVKSLARFYVDNLNGLDELPEDVKSELLLSLGEMLEKEEPVLSNVAESRCSNFKDRENQDIQELRSNLLEWSKLREGTLKRRIDKIERDRLIKLIEQKKKELKEKEEFLYFYDNLKRSKITRIEYK